MDSANPTSRHEPDQEEQHDNPLELPPDPPDLELPPDSDALDDIDDRLTDFGVALSYEVGEAWHKMQHSAANSDRLARRAALAVRRQLETVGARERAGIAGTIIYNIFSAFMFDDVAEEEPELVEEVIRTISEMGDCPFTVNDVVDALNRKCSRKVPEN